ncbi:MAG TPA: PfkB family carbohydrate kinase [Chloroflexota bacterium]|nr:PfkB family carbohydrate kinase [Chloroflexota bacterium]
MIVSLGDAALDVFIRPHGEILRGSDVPGALRLLPGGSAANVAVWAARLGAAAGFIGAVGADAAGALLREDLARQGVVAHLPLVPAATAAIAVLVDAAGERAMIADRGAAALLAPEMIQLEWIPPGCRLHIPAYSLFEEPVASAALRAVTLCRAGGGRVSVDTSSAGPLRAFGPERFLALLTTIAPDVLFANADEGALLSGHNEAEAGIAALRRYASLVVWKQGADGALALDEQITRVAGLPAAVLDSTGAGDAFAAAFLVAHDNGTAPAQALARANALAARVVQHIGARPVIRLPNAAGLIAHMPPTEPEGAS